MSNALTRLVDRFRGAPAPDEGGYALANLTSSGELERRSFSSLEDGFGWSVVAGEQPTVFQGSGREVRELGFEKHPIVQACVRVIADIVATVDFEVYTKNTDGEITILPMSPALQLLHSPRVGMNRVQLRKLYAVHMMVYGNAFWVLERSRPNGPPTSIQVVHPENIQYGYLDPSTLEFAKYQWRDRVGRTHTTLAEDMVHFKDMSASDWLFGFPRAAAALIDISSDYEAGQFVRQVVKNNGSPSLAVLVEGAPRIEELRVAEERFREKQVGRGGRGGVSFMSGVKDLRQIAFNFRDLEFTALRAIAREDMCAVFGVDPRMIGVASAKGAEGGLSGVQYREARFRLIQQTVLPMMGDMESTLDDWFMPEFGYQYVRFNPDSLSSLTENEVETSDRSVKEMAAGLITREEARTRINMPEDMDEDDTLVGSPTRQEYPVSEQFDHAEGLQTNAPLAGNIDPNAPPPAPGAAPGAPGVPTPDSATPEKPPADPKAPPVGKAVRSRVVKRGTALSKDQRTQLWSLFDTRATRQEGPYRQAAMALFHSEKNGVRKTFDDAAEKEGRSHPARRSSRSTGDESDPYVQAALRAITADYAPGGDYHTAWLDRYQALIGTTVNASGTTLGDTVGFDFNLENPRVQAAIAARAEKLATLVGQTTATKITDAVSAGRAAGMGISDIAGMIDDSVFDGTAASRAETIARTESVSAMNQGEYLSAKESGVIQSAEWLSQGDDLVRESHAEVDGELIDLGDTFSNGLMFPGDPNGAPEEVINCYLPGTLVSGAFVAGIRSEYAGPAVEIVTRSGQRLSVTPNHPVMTAQGLRPAGTLRAGDDLLADRRVVEPGCGAKTDDQHAPSRIEDVFDALREHIPTLRHHLRVDDLHGDARHVQGEVEIVRPDGLLLLDGESARAEYGGDVVLVPEPMRESLHAGDSAPDLHGGVVMAASPSRPRGAELLLDGTRLLAETRPFEALSIALPAQLDAALLELSHQRDADEAALITDLLKRHAALITTDQVVEVRHFAYAGHVYDLQSESGLMIAQGIVNSNCRCTMLYHDEDSSDESDDS